MQIEIFFKSGNPSIICEWKKSRKELADIFIECETIIIEDVKGNWHYFEPNNIERIKVFNEKI